MWRDSDRVLIQLPIWRRCVINDASLLIFPVVHNRLPGTQRGHFEDYNNHHLAILFIINNKRGGRREEDLYLINNNQTINNNNNNDDDD